MSRAVAHARGRLRREAGTGQMNDHGPLIARGGCVAGGDRQGGQGRPKREGLARTRRVFSVEQDIVRTPPAGWQRRSRAPGSSDRRARGRSRSGSPLRRISPAGQTRAHAKCRVQLDVRARRHIEAVVDILTRRDFAACGGIEHQDRRAHVQQRRCGDRVARSITLGDLHLTVDHHQDVVRAVG